MNRKKKRSICLLLLTALVTLSLTGCGQKEKVTGEKVVLNEVAHSIFYAPMYVAIEEGYFAEEGIDLTLVTGFGADKTMTAVLSGEADIGFMGPESTIYTYLGETDDPVINFAQLTQRAGNFMVARDDSDFSWQDLKGKKVVSILSGGNMDVITMSSIVQHGLIQRDRIFSVSVLLPDKPGELVRVAATIAKANGNVIKLEHNQFVSTNRNAAVELRITLEAFGTEHKHQIMKALEDEGLSPREVNAKLY